MTACQPVALEVSPPKSVLGHRSLRSDRSLGTEPSSALRDLLCQGRSSLALFRPRNRATASAFRVSVARVACHNIQEGDLAHRQSATLCLRSHFSRLWPRDTLVYIRRSPFFDARNPALEVLFVA